MKLSTIAKLASFVALLMPIGVTAQSLTDFQQLSPEDRRAYIEAMSPEEREAKRNEWRAQRDAMSDEERQAMRDQHKAERGDRRAQWDAMSDEERTAKREQMRGRRDEMRRRYDAMSPEERDAIKQKRREHGERDGQGRGQRQGNHDRQQRDTSEQL